MPRLSAWFIRAALTWLAVGFTAGALLLANKGWPISAGLWRLLPLHMEALLVGWLMQLAIGVAYWILPRWQNQRGEVRPAWAAFFLINVGVLFAAIAPWTSEPSRLMTLARSLEAVGAAGFALHAWPRVKPFMERSKPEVGEG